MVQVGCCCKGRNDIVINSYKQFKELEKYFKEQLSKGVFKEIPVTEPFYVGYSKTEKKEMKWYATKWYKCNVCGCIWEFNYPDFPTKGFLKALN